MRLEVISVDSGSRWNGRIDGDTMIPELLQATPEARPVLDRYGLRGCGGPLGPSESLAFFARAHDVPLEQMLSELRAAVQTPARPSPPQDSLPEARWEDTIYRPFFKSGIALVLTLGAAWGAYLLLRIALTGQFAAAGLHEVNAHGHAQIFGWVGLFVMGFAYQAFPRFKHASLAWPRLAMATLVMMLAGIVGRSIAQPLAVTSDAAWWVAVAASVLEVAAIAMFVAIIVETWRRSEKSLTFYDNYILAALGWFLVQAVYESVYLTATLSASGPSLTSLVATWRAPLRDIQIHGFALLMILGVSQRIFHHFYGLPQPNQRLSKAMLVVLNAAIVGEAVGLILMRLLGREWAALWYASAVALAAAVAVLVWDWRIYSKPEDPDRSLKFLRAGYAWLLISLGMLVLLPAYQFIALRAISTTGAATVEFSHAYYGAIRHAITVGFISMMIVGVSAKVVPTLNGVSSRMLSPLWGPFVLINLGCALRVSGQTLTDFTTFAFPIAGVSGLLEVTGLAIWGAHLWKVMAGRVKSSGSEETSASMKVGDGPIRGEHTVGVVLEEFPELLEVFVAHGFTMLANPQLRRTIARVVTIEKACRRTGVDLHAFLEALNAKIGHKDCCPSCASKASHARRAPVEVVSPSQVRLNKEN